MPEITAPSRPICVLVGPPGSGKSTVGRALAQALATDFRDTDHDIETATGRHIADIFTESGEAAFRQLEHHAVRVALAEHQGVLALGGGAILDSSTRELLHEQRVVFLDVGLAHAMRRLGMNRSRPLLVGNVRGQWQSLMAARRPLYEEVADITVLTDDHKPSELVRTLEHQLRK